MDTRSHNRAAWDHSAEKDEHWSVPVTREAIVAAREGDWSIILTPRKPVPRSWFPALEGLDVLCLAGAGGQQGPILAAAGALVTVFDNSPGQLAKDQLVADREGLTITTALGDMADLSRFDDGSFDLVVHPCSNCFVESVRPVWREASRVLRRGGSLLAGFCQPILLCLDPELEEKGIMQMKYAVPYSSLTSITEEARRQLVEKKEPFTFGHTLEDQIGGQLDAGLVLTGFYEDIHLEGVKPNDWMPTFGATRALKT